MCPNLSSGTFAFAFGTIGAGRIPQSPIPNPGQRQNGVHGLHSKRHHCSRRARARASPARHVYRRGRQRGPASSRLGDPRQLHRRGDERARLEHLGDPSQGRLFDHDRGRWARYPDRQAPDQQEERAGGHLHRAARGRQIRPRQLQDRRRPPRRRRQRRQCPFERARRDGSPRRRGMGAALQAGKAARASEEGGTGARQRHQGLLPPRSRHFPEDRARGGDYPRAARSRELPAQRPQDRLRGRERAHEGNVRTYRGPSCVPAEDRQREGSQARPRRRLLAREGERHAGRSRPAVDRGDGRAHPQLRQRHSDRIRRYSRERDARGPGQGGAQLHRHAQPVAEGRDADGRGYPRRADRRPQRVRGRAAVSGTDEGSAE